MNQQEALSAAITLTDEILGILEKGEFERVEELEAQRKTYIEQVFADSIEHIDRIKAQHLQSLNQQVVDKLNNRLSSSRNAYESRQKRLVPT
jgi:hypothetical protein